MTHKRNFEINWPLKQLEYKLEKIIGIKNLSTGKVGKDYLTGVSNWKDFATCLSSGLDPNMYAFTKKSFLLPSRIIHSGGKA